MAEDVAAGDARLRFEVDASTIDMLHRDVVRVELEQGCAHSKRENANR